MEWMKAMPGTEHLKIIIMDEDALLLHVIPHVFPSSIH